MKDIHLLKGTIIRTIFVFVELVALIVISVITFSNDGTSAWGYWGAGGDTHRGIGVCSTKYGKIDDTVLQMEVVLPNGDIIYTSPAPKHALGPDLNQIFIGSEGTLGIITKAQIRIFDQPEERRFRGFLFQDMHGAFEASRELLQKFKPSVMRLYLGRI